MKTPDDASVPVRERVLLELAKREKSDLVAMFSAITEATAAVLDVERVSIWELQGGTSRGTELVAKLVCKDLFLASERKHVTFMPIHGRDFPSYLRAIQERRTITADDARQDHRTREFAAFYLEPLGITSMLDVPIWQGGQVYGVLCLEHVGTMRKWRWDERDFAINISDIATSAIEAAARVATTSRWMSVIESLSEAVIVMDGDGGYMEWNSAGSRLFRNDDGHIQKREDLRRDVDLVDAIDRPLSDEDWPYPRARRGEVVRGEIYGVVFKKTGERRYIRATCSPVSQEGRIVGYVLVADDATEDVFVERLKRELLSGLAHELKTPLTIAKGYAQELASISGLPTRCYRMFDAIRHASDRMDRLSETMLDLASVILGRLRLTRERIDFADLVRSTVRRMTTTFPERRIELHGPDDPVLVVVDAARITQAVRHIIDNALSYSSSETVVAITIAREAKSAMLTVRDQGIGIPEKLKDSVFDPFFKAHIGTNDDRGGLGIGLYLAREIIVRHGGDLSFESVESQGSVFRLTLPLAEGS